MAQLINLVLIIVVSVVVGLLILHPIHSDKAKHRKRVHDDIQDIGDFVMYVGKHKEDLPPHIKAKFDELDNKLAERRKLLGEVK